MKIHLHFKTPDVVDYAVQYLREDQKAEAKAAIEKYVEYGECISVEIDTVTLTARVIPRE